MKNTHLEHPEDLILTGDLNAIRALYSDAHISMKMDGCPAIVWGTYKDKFFVCTKSAFNKRKIKLCYSIDDIYDHFGHQESVCEILRYCFRYLPRTKNVYQGDFLGFGRTDMLNPNTLVYLFDKTITQKLVIAPHTQYTVKGEMCEAEAFPLLDTFQDTAIIKWVQPIVDRICPEIDMTDIDTSKIQFLTMSEAARVKKEINALIKEGIELTDPVLLNILGDIYLTNLYQMVIEMKEEVMNSFIIYNAPDCYLPDGRQVIGEGFVMSTEYGMIKLVDRTVFSHANMTQGKFS